MWLIPIVKTLGELAKTSQELFVIVIVFVFVFVSVNFFGHVMSSDQSEQMS